MDFPTFRENYFQALRSVQLNPGERKPSCVEIEERIKTEYDRQYYTKEWAVYVVLESEIRAKAKAKGISLRGIDMEIIVRFIKKGVSESLDNIDEIINDSIKNARKI